MLSILSSVFIFSVAVDFVTIQESELGKYFFQW